MKGGLLLFTQTDIQHGESFMNLVPLVVVLHGMTMSGWDITMGTVDVNQLWYVGILLEPVGCR